MHGCRRGWYFGCRGCRVAMGARRFGCRCRCGSRRDARRQCPFTITSFARRSRAITAKYIGHTIIGYLIPACRELRRVPFARTQACRVRRGCGGGQRNARRSVNITEPGNGSRWAARAIRRATGRLFPSVSRSPWDGHVYAIAFAWWDVVRIGCRCGVAVARRCRGCRWCECRCRGSRAQR